MVSAARRLLQANAIDRPLRSSPTLWNPPVPPGPLITIIDDDASIRSATASLLRSAGYATLCFESADAFLAATDARACACVVTDISMPGTSGLDLATHLGDALPALPFILMTARTEAAILNRADAIGAVCVLRKPFSADQLMGCVERALGRG
jgi:FixJ family two-component response regulator